MVKQWSQHKSEINSLYMVEKKTLDEVREILKRKYGFRASVRAYRMKLDEWNMRKNKSSKDLAVMNERLLTSLASDTTVDTRTDSSREATIDPSFPRYVGSESPLFDLRSIVAPLTTRKHSRKDERLPDTKITVQEALRRASCPPKMPIQYEQYLSKDFHLAITNGTLQGVQNIIAVGADVNSRDAEGNTPLHTAVRRRRPHMVETLIQHSADVNVQNKNGNTPLHVLLCSRFIAGQDLMSTLMLLLSSGAKINIPNTQGHSALLYAVWRLHPSSMLGDVQVVIELLKGFTSPRSSIGNFDEAFTEFLNTTSVSLVTGARWPNSFPYYPYYEEWKSISAAVASCICHFLRIGATPSVMVQGTTLLFFCLRYMFLNNDASLNLIVMLLQTADVDLADVDGNLPLHCLLLNTSYQASMDSGTTILDKIISKMSIDVNRPNKQGRTALELLFEGTTVENCTSLITVRSARILIAAGAKPALLNASGRTVFDCPSLSAEAKPDVTCFRTILLELLLKGDIMNQSLEDNRENTAAWATLWRSAWNDKSWSTKLEHYIEFLKFHPSMPACPQFYECISKLIAEKRLKVSMDRCLAERKERNEKQGDLYCEAYVSILKTCKKEAIPINPQWYVKVVDILDTKLLSESQIEKY